VIWQTTFFKLNFGLLQLYLKANQLFWLAEFKS